MLYCNVCGKECKDKRGLSSHLSKIHNMNYKEYYDIYLIEDGEGTCKNPKCSKKTNFDRKKDKYKDLCYNCSRTIDEDVYKIKYGEEYAQKIEEVRNRYRHNLQFFIEKYGEEEGTRIYEDWLNKKGVTLENQIEKYGKEEGIKNYEKWREKVAFTLENQIEKYGEEEGTRRYYDHLQSLQGRFTPQWYIDKYGEEEGIKKHKERKESVRLTKENFIDKYGEEEGVRRWNDLCHKNQQTNTLQWHIDNYGEEEGTKRYENWKEKIKVGLGKASQESLEVFFSLMDWLLENKICSTLNEIYVGISDSKEYFLRNNSTFYLYDFTIPKFNIIIEYHGEEFHPNPRWLEEDESKWENWRQAITQKDASEVFKKDLEKSSLAKEKGFDILELWSSDGQENNLEKCKNFIKLCNE